MAGRDLNFPQASESFKRMNAHLLGGVGMPKTPSMEAYVYRGEKVKGCDTDTSRVIQSMPATKAVRQKSGDGMNKTERAAYEYLRDVYCGVKEPRRGEHGLFSIKPHGLTIQLGNGVRFIPDVIVEAGGKILAFEVKAMRGRRVHVEDDASVKVKLAASIWQSIGFTLMWRDKRTGAWEMQEILP